MTFFVRLYEISDPRDGTWNVVEKILIKIISFANKTLQTPFLRSKIFIWTLVILILVLENFLAFNPAQFLK